MGFPARARTSRTTSRSWPNPRTDAGAAQRFNDGARRLWVAPDELVAALEKFRQHAASGRPRERDHALVHRDVRLAVQPEPPFRLVDEDARRDPAEWSRASPMTAVDRTFTAIVRANPQLRPRVGNPDEMRSNRLLERSNCSSFG
jgi:phosphoketolase